MGRPSQGDICRYMQAKEREAIWAAEHGPVPLGRRVGWTCAVPYCGKLEHMELAENYNSTRFNWKPYVEKIRALSPDEYLDFPELTFPTTRVGSCLAMNDCSIKFKMRSLPFGGMRIIRVGTWETYSTEGFESKKPWPILTGKRIAFHKRPAIIWLGQNFNVGRTVVVSQERCHVKGCAFPAFRGAGNYCYQHNHFFDYNISMTWNG